MIKRMIILLILFCSCAGAAKQSATVKQERVLVNTDSLICEWSKIPRNPNWTKEQKKAWLQLMSKISRCHLVGRKK